MFGFDDFRPGQEAVVRAAVEGRDTLALMPTGSGKSLTYQLAAMLRPTPTLVLSPLIALMKDQVDKLPPEVAAQSTLINSSLDPDEAAARLRGVSEGRYRMLYVAPERLRSRNFLDAISHIDIGLVVIDEVHCVSMWGHDFRPDYLFIRRALDALGTPAILGMTATATPATEREIADALGREPEIVRTSVVRPNLRYDVEIVDGEEARLRTLVRRLRELRGASAIVYARSRRSCESLARTLRAHDLAAVHYHAGLEPAERAAAQEAFIEGRIQTVVATTAFGMGIDKPDIRLVALYNYPESLESYVQMVGRAGRDGRASDTLLLASRADAQQLRRFARSDIPTVDDLRSVYARLRGRSEVSPEELGDEPDPRVLVGMLEQVGLVRRGFDAGRAMQIEVPDPPADAAARIDALLARYEREALARTDRLVHFAESRGCRHRQVAEHFGETLAEDCGMCDVCSPLAAPRRRAGSRRAAAGRRRRRHPSRRARPALAARPHGSGGDAPRLDERAALGAALLTFRRACRGQSGRHQALDPAARGLGGARVVRERGRLPPPPRAHRASRSAANRLAGRCGTGRRRALRTAPRLAARARAGRRGARVRRAARRDTPRARDREAGFRAGSRGGQRLRPHQARALRRRCALAVIAAS